jgi:hypothetical protein
MLKAVKYKISEVPQWYWDFVHKYGLIYQSKPYLECLAISGQAPLVVGVFEDDKFVGGAGITIGRKILNFPVNMAIYLGPVVSDAQKTVAVLKCIADAVKTNCFRFSVTVLPEQADILAESSEISGWHKTEIEFLHWDISDSLESLFKTMKKSKREAMRKAQREGAIIKEIETPEEVEQFFELYSASMHKGGLQPESLLYHKNLISMLKPADLSAGFLALHPEIRKPIAGIIMLLGMHKEATFLSMGHNYEYRKFCAPDLLWWHCLEFLKSKGYVLADFGGLPKGNSQREKGIRDYKIALVGVNGRRYPSFVLTHGNFGLNPQFVKKVSIIFKRLIAFISKGSRK